MIWLMVIGGTVFALFALTVFRGAPYVPSRRKDVGKAFNELHHVTKHDVLLDIGSGDGTVLREASRRGARAVGFEINPILVAVSKWLSRKDHLISVRLVDFWLAKFPSETTIVYTFGESRDINKMYQKVQKEATRLERSIWFMSYGFTVPNVTATKSIGAHHLYNILPLQKGGA